MALRAKKRSKCEEGAPDYMLTYGGYNFVVCFFVTMFSLNDVIFKENILKIMSASFTGSGFFKGGKTLDIDKLSYLSNSFMSLPSTAKNKQASQTARNKSMIEFIEKIQSKSVIVRRLERGVIVSLLADTFLIQLVLKLSLMEIERLQKDSIFIGFLDEQG